MGSKATLNKGKRHEMDSQVAILVNGSLRNASTLPHHLALARTDWLSGDFAHLKILQKCFRNHLAFVVRCNTTVTQYE